MAISRGRVFGLVLLLGAFAAGFAIELRAKPEVRHPALRRASSTSVSDGCWVTAWGASPQAPIETGQAREAWRGATVRDVVRTTFGGPALRIQLTNVYGRRPLVIAGATIAIQSAGAAVVPGSVRQVTFGGRGSQLVAPGTTILSDPVRLRVGRQQRLAISVFTPSALSDATLHADANGLNYVAAGDHTGDPGASAYGRVTLSWLYLDRVEALSPGCRARAVVALGDSLTDGFGSTVNANARWTDDLAHRIAGTSGAQMAVVNEGIAGNRVLHGSRCCGTDALSRLRRDVLTQPGATDLIVLEGINDIGFSRLVGRGSAPHTQVTAHDLISGYSRIIARARAAGLHVFAGTLLPFRGAAYWSPHGERVREQVNEWIRSSHAFDGVIDFASAVADPLDPQRLNPVFDRGDHLHLNDAGYRAMAAAVDLRQLRLRSGSDAAPPAP